MLWIIEKEGFFQPQAAGHFLRVVLVLEHDVANGSAGTRHRIVRHVDEVSRVSFIQQLEDGASGENRDVITVGLNGSKHFSAVWLAGLGTLDGDRRGVSRGPGAARFVLALECRVRLHHGGGEWCGEKLSAFHEKGHFSGLAAMRG
jgi:hypothetical protein